MTVPKVTVVVPTYNRAHMLATCLASIARQTYDDLEVVVVDDGSDDNTAEVVARFAGVRYVRQENQGAPGAYNRGVAEAGGEYVMLVDSDDSICEDAVATEARVLDANPDVGLVYAQAWQVNEAGAVTGLRRPEFARHSYVRNGREEIRALLFWNHITSPTPMVRRRCFETVGLFDPRLRVGEDWDMWIRIAKRYDVAYVARPLGNYLKHAGNISTRIDLEFLEFLRRYLLEKVLDDPEIGHIYRPLRGKAYFAYHTYIGAMAYKANAMALARSHLVAAFGVAPGRALTPSGLWAASLLPRTLVPLPVLTPARSAMRALRSRVTGQSGG